MKPPLNPALQLRLPLGRARVLVALLLLWFGVLAARAMYLQVWQNDFLQQEGASRFTRIIELPAHRGMITDRYGEPLAISTPVESVWATPADVQITPSQRRQLANLLDLDELDRADEQTFNQILWRAQKGHEVPYPAAPARSEK